MSPAGPDPDPMGRNRGLGTGMLSPPQDGLPRGGLVLVPILWCSGWAPPAGVRLEGVERHLRLRG